MDNNPQNKNKSQAEGSSDSIKADHAKIRLERILLRRKMMEDRIWSTVGMRGEKKKQN